MTQYHATMIDECGDEFGVTLDVDDGVENVSEYFREMYPESRLLFVEPAAGVSVSEAQAHAVWAARWDDDTVDLY
jgi:hypothetical protein